MQTLNRHGETPPNVETCTIGDRKKTRLSDPAFDKGTYTN
jgi:hypothetical protein